MSAAVLWDEDGTAGTFQLPPTAVMPVPETLAPENDGDVPIFGVVVVVDVDVDDPVPALAGERAPAARIAGLARISRLARIAPM